jgi:hypothetical protein
MRVTAKLLFVVVGVTIGMTPAAGQTIDRRTYYSDVAPSNYLPRSPRANETCLWNKVEKRNECRSRAEWRKIAAKLETRQPRKENAANSR